ncbi:MAG: hypothetical protein NZ929_01730 [Aigarchaeota archaeon]|nr:hypothetical protein [Aigarchaeota archaeon]MCX8192949.1 hypothetical protein [Nitrososphaeria archaeon]MDW7986406.1 hypothetical protein [Nitrososphaerota archaeon]
MSKSRAYKALLVVEEYVNLKALAHLLEFISRNVEITFLHVVEFPLPTSIYPETVAPYIEKAKERFRELLDWAKSQEIKAELKVVASRDLSEAVLTELENVEYDFIIIQREIKKIKRKIRELFRRTYLEKIVDKTRRVVIVLPFS